MASQDPSTEYEVIDHVDEDMEEKEPPEPEEKLNTSLGERDICTICLEDYTTTGDHRPASLKCGHIFGMDCIKRWIQQKGNNSSCPQCNQKTRMFQVRLLYFSNVKLIDTQERDNALNRLHHEQELRHSIESEYNELFVKYSKLEKDYSSLQDQIKFIEAKNTKITRDMLKAALFGDGKNEVKLTDGYSGKYIAVFKYPISEESRIRCFGCSPFNNLLYVADHVKTPLFQSWGVKKINSDFKNFKFTSLHAEMIRGMAFARESPYLITASGDKTVKLLNISNDQVGLTVNCPTQVWSVEWNHNGPDGFYAGCSSGVVLLFDLRVPTKPLHTFNPASNMISAVHSLSYVPKQKEGFQGGILVGQLNGFSLLQADRNGSLKESDTICSFTRNQASTIQIACQPEPMDESTVSRNVPDTFEPEDDDLFLGDDETDDQLEEQTRSENLYSDVIREWPRYHYKGLTSESGLASLSSVSVNNEIHFLTSFRNGANHQKVRHLLNQIYSFDDINSATYSQTHSLNGGTVHVPLFKSRLFLRGQDAKLHAVTGDMGSNSALLWRCDTGELVQQITHPAIKESSPVIDMTPLDANGQNIALLTKKDILIYDWKKSCK